MLPTTRVRTNVAEIAKGYCNQWVPPLLFTLWAAQALFTVPISVKKKKWLTGKVAAREPFRKFEPNELARIHKRVIFSRDTNYPRMADVKSLLKWEFISMGGVTSLL